MIEGPAVWMVISVFAGQQMKLKLLTAVSIHDNKVTTPVGVVHVEMENDTQALFRWRVYGDVTTINFLMFVI